VPGLRVYGTATVNATTDFRARVHGARGEEVHRADALSQLGGALT
jgi:hypothetical protein